MVTLGPKGCLLKNKQADFSCGCPKVHPIDTTGAGDIFGGSAVSRFLELGKAPEALTRDDLAYMARYAAPQQASPPKLPAPSRPSRKRKPSCKRCRRHIACRRTHTDNDSTF